MILTFLTASPLNSAPFKFWIRRPKLEVCDVQSLPESVYLYVRASGTLLLLPTHVLFSIMITTLDENLSQELTPPHLKTSVC